MPAPSISILALTVTASGSVGEARFVTCTGAQAGAEDNTLGVNRYSVTVGQTMAVDVQGTVAVEAGAAIVVGAAIETDIDGRAVTKVNGPIVARALQAASGAGSFIEVLLIPN